MLSPIIHGIFPGKQLDFLSKEEIEGIQLFIQGKNTFASLRTRHGKSLIFQLALPVALLLLCQAIGLIKMESFAKKKFAIDFKNVI